jgi:hypothetical protein
MIMSAFDPDQFMNTTVEGELDTKRPVAPAAQYNVQVFKITPKSGTIGKGDNAGKTWAAFLLTLEVMDEALKAELGQDKVFVSYQVFLDLDDNEQLDMRKGRNVALGKLRSACAQNDGSPWSPAMLLGQMLVADVTVGVNPKSGDEINNVRGVAAYEG